MHIFWNGCNAQIRPCKFSKTRSQKTRKWNEWNHRNFKWQFKAFWSKVLEQKFHWTKSKDYIHTWKNSVIIARSLDSAKSAGNRQSIAESSLAAFAIFQVSTASGEFCVMLHEQFKYKKWCPVQVSLAWSVYKVICTETWTPGCSDHVNNQIFIKVSNIPALHYNNTFCSNKLSKFSLPITHQSFKKSELSPPEFATH